MMAPRLTLHTAGRLALLRCRAPLSGGPDPEELAGLIEKYGVRAVLLDTTEAAWADSEGLRWLLALQEALARHGRSLRIVARQGGRVWRNMALLNANLLLFPSVRAAWHG